MRWMALRTLLGLLQLTGMLPAPAQRSWLARRVEAGWTMQELATAASVSRRTVARLERSGRCLPASRRRVDEALTVREAEVRSAARTRPRPS